MDMSALLADVFGTKIASAQVDDDELIKQANLAFFSELCEREGINVDQLDDDQVGNLFKTAMEIKAAADEEDDNPSTESHEKGETAEKEKEEEKKEAAKLAAANDEYMQKRATAVKVAEAEAMGKIMAHSFVAELDKISADLSGTTPAPEDSTKEASVARAEALISAFDQIKQAHVASQTTSTPNFDELSARHAIEMLKQAGVDEDVAVSRVSAAYTLGIPESTKIASAADANTALELRALEFCDAAGFQVDWNKV